MAPGAGPGLLVAIVSGMEVKLSLTTGVLLSVSQGGGRTFIHLPHAQILLLDRTGVVRDASSEVGSHGCDVGHTEGGVLTTQRRHKYTYLQGMQFWGLSFGLWLMNHKFTFS